MTRSKNKYGAKKTLVGDILFDSGLEARGWKELKLLEAAKEISELQRQIAFIMIVAGKKICKWTVDYTFIQDGQKIARDAKGVIARDVIIRKKLAEALYPEWRFQFWPMKVKKSGRRK